MTKVWKSAPYKGQTLLALLALADWADDEGYCFPGIRQIAKKSRQSERNAQRCIHRMVRDGLLIVHEAGGGRREGGKMGHRPTYQINTDNLSPFQKGGKGDKTTDKRVTNVALKGDKHDIAIRKNHQYEPSKGNHQGRRLLSQAERDSWDLRRYMQELKLIQEAQRGSGADPREQERIAGFRAGVTPERREELIKKCFSP